MKKLLLLLALAVAAIAGCKKDNVSKIKPVDPDPDPVIYHDSVYLVSTIKYQEIGYDITHSYFYNDKNQVIKTVGNEFGFF